MLHKTEEGLHYVFGIATTPLGHVVHGQVELNGLMGTNVTAILYDTLA